MNRGTPPIPEKPRPAALGMDLEQLNGQQFRAMLLSLRAETKELRRRDYSYWFKRWRRFIDTPTDQAYERGLLTEDKLLDLFDQLLTKVERELIR